MNDRFGEQADKHACWYKYGRLEPDRPNQLILESMPTGQPCSDEGRHRDNANADGEHAVGDKNESERLVERCRSSGANERAEGGVHETGKSRGAKSYWHGQRGRTN